MPSLSPTGALARWLALLALLFAVLFTGQAQESEHGASQEPKDFTAEEKKAWDHFWVLWESRGAVTVMEESERLCRTYPDNPRFILLRAMLLRETGENTKRRQLLWDWWDRTGKRTGHSPRIALKWSHSWQPPQKMIREKLDQIAYPERVLALWLLYAAEDFPEERSRLNAALFVQNLRELESKTETTFSHIKKTLDQFFDDETKRAFFKGKTSEEDPVIWTYVGESMSGYSYNSYSYPDSDDVEWLEKVARRLLREEKLAALFIAPKNSSFFTEAFRWTVQQKLSHQFRSLTQITVVEPLISRLLPANKWENADIGNEYQIPGWSEEDWDQLHLLSTGERYRVTPYLTTHRFPVSNLRLAFALRVKRVDFEGMVESLRGGAEDIFDNPIKEFGPALNRALIRAELIGKPVPWPIVAGMVARFYDGEFEKYGTYWMLPTADGSSSSPDPFWNQEDKDSPVFYGPPELISNRDYQPGKFFSELFDTLPQESRFPLWWELRKLNKASLRELDEAWLLSSHQMQESFRLPEKADDFCAALAEHVRALPRWFPREAEPWLPFLLHEANRTQLSELPLMLRCPGRKLLEREAAGHDAWAARAWLETWAFAEWEWRKEEYWQSFQTRAPYWMGEKLLYTYAVDAAWVPRRTAYPAQFRSLLEEPKGPHGLPPVLRLALVTLLFRHLGADVLPPTEVTDLFLRLSPKLSLRDWAGLLKCYAHPSDLFPFETKLPEREARSRRIALSHETDAFFWLKANDL